jgi:hypothetical protein
MARRPGSSRSIATASRPPLVSAWDLADQDEDEDLTLAIREFRHEVMEGGDQIPRPCRRQLGWSLGGREDDEEGSGGGS